MPKPPSTSDLLPVLAALVTSVGLCVGQRAYAQEAATGDDAAPPLTAEARLRASADDGERPSPLQVDYAQYGMALAGKVPFEPGGICPSGAVTPCIIGAGFGPVLRGGYRPSGPWYFGGAYQFAKLDSNNLLRLPILQELRAELRYFIDVGSRFSPYVTAALGGVIYGNEFTAETAGAMAFAGAGVEFEVTRFAVVGLSLEYEPVLFVGFEDTARQVRDTGVAHFLHMELVVELRTELSRE